MKILLILTGLVLNFALFYPPIFSSVYKDEVFKAFLFFIGMFILLGGLGRVVNDWLKHKARNNRGRNKNLAL